MAKTPPDLTKPDLLLHRGFRITSDATGWIAWDDDGLHIFTSAKDYRALLARIDERLAILADVNTKKKGW